MHQRKFKHHEILNKLLFVETGAGGGQTLLLCLKLVSLLCMSSITSDAVYEECNTARSPTLSVSVVMSDVVHETHHTHIPWCYTISVLGGA